MPDITDNEFMVLELFEAAEIAGAPPPTNDEIGTRLGWTRNAAAGACRRLRDKGMIRRRPKSKLLRDRMRYWDLEDDKPVENVAQPVDEDPIPWNIAVTAPRLPPKIEAKPRPCQWFMKDLPKYMRLAWRQIDDLKCGEPCVSERPYCEEHNRRARGAA